MASNTFTSIFTAVTVLSASAFLYFDYKRRNDFEFRKSLAKRERKFHESKAAVKQEEVKGLLRKYANLINMELTFNPLPANPEDSEALFGQLSQKGEQLCSQGPEKYEEAALCFYKSLLIFPTPLKLLEILQSVVPPPVFEILTLMIAAAPPANLYGSASAAAQGAASAAELTADQPLIEEDVEA
ncbi:hypothetical protein QEN19_003631 [Hanseniaspora menglaensis]